MNVAKNVNDNGDIISQLLRIVNVPICVTSVRSGELAGASPFVQRRLYTLLNRGIFRKNRLGGTFLTSCLFKRPSRTEQVGRVVRPRIGSSFQH